MLAVLLAAISPQQWAQSAAPDSFAKVWVFSGNPYKMECLGAALRSRSAWLDASSFWMPGLAVAHSTGVLRFVSEGRFHEANSPKKYNYGDSYCYDQITALNLDKVHDQGYIGTGILLGIFDTGFDLDHPSISYMKNTDKVVASHDFNSGDSLFTEKGPVPLPDFPPGSPVYINSTSTLTAGSATGLVFAATCEDSLLGSGYNHWGVYLTWGDTSGNFGVVQRISTSSYSLEPEMTLITDDTVGICWQSWPGFTVVFQKTRLGSSPSGAPLSIGTGIDPQIASTDSQICIVYYDGEQLLSAVSKDTGSSFSLDTVFEISDYWGADAISASDTIISVFSDGDNLLSSWFDGSEWHHNLISQGIYPSCFSGDSVYIAFWRNDSLWFASSPGASGAFDLRFTGVLCPQAGEPPAVGTYRGQLVIAVQDTAGSISLVSKTGQTVKTIGQEFSRRPGFIGNNALWVRRGDPDTKPDPGPNHYHGTKMLSVIAGLSEGTLVGTGPGVSLLLAKTEKTAKTDGSGQFENVVEEDFWVEALEWTARHKGNIVSSSLGYRDWYSDADMDGNTAPSSRAASKALQAGVLVFNSMGNIERTGALPNPNVGDTSLGAPADAENICAVGGVTYDTLNQMWVPAFNSAFGPSSDGRTKPELVAPFVAIAAADTVFFGSDDTTRYLVSQGTSYSCALAAGAAASVWQAHPSWTPEKLRSVLLSTATQLSSYPDSNYLTGYGMLNAWEALNAEPPETQAKDKNALLSPWPNPFNPDRDGVINFPYRMFNKSSVLEIRVYTMDGLLVWQDIKRDQSPGSEQPFQWNGQTLSGHNAQSGLYIVLLKSITDTDVAKFVITR